MKLKALQWESNGFLDQFTQEYWDSVSNHVDLVNMSRVPERLFNDIIDRFPYFHYIKQNSRDDGLYLITASKHNILSKIKKFRLPAYSKVKNLMPGGGSVAISYYINDTQIVNIHPTFSSLPNGISDRDNIQDLSFIFQNIVKSKNCAVIGDFHKQPNIVNQHTSLINRNKFTSHLDSLGTFTQHNDGRMWYDHNEKTGKLTKKEDPWEHTIFVTNLDRCLTRGEVTVENVLCYHTPIENKSLHFAVSYNLTII
jgi:hypothetical protein